jgi:hypothetical protein
MTLGVALVAVDVLAGWVSYGPLGALALGGFGAFVAWMAFRLSLIWTDLGSLRSARRDLRQAERDGDRGRQILAKIRLALVRYRRR